MNVSVIIPTYNRPKELLSTIHSVLKQTVLPKEIIVIDDHSTVKAKAELSNLSEKTEIIYHRFNKNQGACAARNKGIELSSGEIIMFLDDDDRWEPNKIKDQLSKFNNEVGLVYTGKKVVTESNRNKVDFTIDSTFVGDCYPNILRYNYIGSTSGVAVKKSILIDAGMFDESMLAMQDYDLWIRICKLTNIDHDEGHNLIYTIADDPKNQISGNPKKYQSAGVRLLEKYSEDISKLPTNIQRKIKANRYFSIAKTSRKSGVKEAFPWIKKSLSNSFEFKTLALLLPIGLVNRIRKATR